MHFSYYGQENLTESLVLDFSVWHALSITHFCYRTCKFITRQGYEKYNILPVFKSDMKSYILLQTAAIFFISNLKADMKSYIPLDTAAIFFLANLFPKQGISSEYVTVDFICMGNSGCKELKPRITKWKILAHTGTRAHDPWFSSALSWGRPVWYTNDNLKLIQ